MNSTDTPITRYVDGVRLTLRRHSYVGYLVTGTPVVIYQKLDGSPLDGTPAGFPWATGHGIDGIPIGAGFVSVKEAIRETERLTGLSFRRTYHH